ncbi:MAG: hypothetical protein E7I16_04170 [Veillonella sp.]|nr:hypothetical protein [Veillonella sp.]
MTKQEAMERFSSGAVQQSHRSSCVCVDCKIYAFRLGGTCMVLSVVARDIMDPS